MASKAYLLQDIHKGVLETAKISQAGDIILTHPLKSLTEEKNRLLAATISCVNSESPLEKAVKFSMKSAGLSVEQGRSLRFLAESVVQARQQVMQQQDSGKGGKRESGRYPSDNFCQKLSEYVAIQIQEITRLSSNSRIFRNLK